ncbi:helix-turn-helix transcriptional regulator [Geosporobacter ferrireducens]|uniref:Transcriptional regulator n=1 Tax=Geosporobacter ferrireducens TaxID=1424294 RepID=A0A1D8GC77_9FIRM|nr:helix-turn-helix transcriptional regulator [Geosporobacter ferrireducens]AOT68511.1 transcriptional regulator [Geosporobacter ferrireducens]MTI53972.1 helix-turn-helix transcriptional regulator [Geosporobacter ferrireducens]
MELSERQQRIVEIVKENEPITSEQIAALLKVTRATLRPDLAILTMSGILDARPKVGYLYAGNTGINIISEHIKQTRVSDIKSIPVIVDEQTSLYDGIVALFLEDVGSIYVVSKGYLTGVVSRKDFLKSIMGGMEIHKVPVGLIMTRMPNIVLTYPHETALEAAIKIIEHEVDSLPVVEKEMIGEKECFKVVGKISKTNIARLFVELGKQ